jgi:hypothetical protein
MSIQDRNKSLVLAIDKVEADLRRLEHQLYRIRQELADLLRVPKKDRGFIEEPTP